MKENYQMDRYKTHQCFIHSDLQKYLILRILLTINLKKLINREQLYQPNKGSGWTLKRCKELSLKLNKHILLNAGSHIELPEQIKSKKACINFANKDNYCFIYSIRCAIDKPNKHADRVKQYEKYINDEIFK